MCIEIIIIIIIMNNNVNISTPSFLLLWDVKGMRLLIPRNNVKGISP